MSHVTRVNIGSNGSFGKTKWQSRETHRADALSWLASCSVTADIAFADPPYALGDQGVYGEVMRLVAERGVVPPGGIFVAEMASRRACDDSPAWELLRDRVYGQSRLAVYRRK